MQQAQQQQQSHFSPVENLAGKALDLDALPDEIALSEDGTSITLSGDTFPLDMPDVYSAIDLNRVCEYTLNIPNAGDSGDTNEITVDTIEVDGELGIVIYDVYKPVTTNDSEWVCPGILTLIKTDAETHADRLKTEVERAKSKAMDTVKQLAVSLLRNSAGGQDLAHLVKAVLADLVDDARYAYVKSEDAVRPSTGEVDVASAIAESGDSVQRMLDMSFAGACLADILIEHPMVESFTVECSTSQESNDHDYFTSKNINIIDVEFVGGVAQVTREGDDEEIDPIQYASDILDEIRDQSLEYDLYDGLAGPGVNNEDFEVVVSRTALADLLEQDVVDGLVVAKIIIATAKES